MQGALGKHLFVVLKHKYYVAKYCFKFGLYWRGIKHDMSKFSPSEFWPSVKFFDGTMSPQVHERKAYGGYSYMCVHHTRLNSHHFQYHVDMVNKHLVIIPMPYKDVIEMFCDSLAAGITYAGKDFTRDNPYNFFSVHKDRNAMHPATKEFLLWMLAEYRDHDIDRLVKMDLNSKYEQMISKYDYVIEVSFDTKMLDIREDE